jgi:aspartate beta-hydroxylase
VRTGQAMGIYDLAVHAIRSLYSERISTPPVLDADAVFPAARRFATAWPEIREEAMSLARQLGEVPRFHDVMREQAEISANDGRDWRVFLLKVYGVNVAKHMAACPRLAELVASEPDVISATLSFLAPHKHIPRHRGPFKGVLRFQLGVSVPLAEDGRPASVLAIEDVEYRIGDGDYLLWDDTYAHEVWNRSNEMRVALLLDVRRRNMPIGLTLFSRFLIATIGLTARLRGLA